MTLFTFDTISDASQFARRRAKYGRRNWVVWPSGGKWLAQRAIPSAIKSALLAEKKVRVYGGCDGLPSHYNWRGGIVLWNNAKYFGEL